MSYQEVIERGREFVRSTEHAGGKHLVSALCDALEASSAPEPQGEPSEAMVMIAAKAIRADLERQNEERHDGPYTRSEDDNEGCIVDGVVNLVEAARAALRAAGGVR